MYTRVSGEYSWVMTDWIHGNVFGQLTDAVLEFPHKQGEEGRAWGQLLVNQAIGKMGLCERI